MLLFYCINSPISRLRVGSIQALGVHLERIAALAIVLLALFGSSATDAAERCAYDKQAFLAMDENAFDQDLAGGGGGWRAIGNIPGCERDAASLLAAYRAKHPAAHSVLAWHEGQMRASAGQYRQAIPLLLSTRKPASEDVAGWNHYVDATVAFLRRDKEALRAARERLVTVPYPQGAGLPPLKDGYFEVPTQPGQPRMRMRWPPNIEVVDGLAGCFSKPYSEASGLSCRAPSH